MGTASACAIVFATVAFRKLRRTDGHLLVAIQYFEFSTHSVRGWALICKVFAGLLLLPPLRILHTVQPKTTICDRKSTSMQLPVLSLAIAAPSDENLLFPLANVPANPASCKQIIRSP